MKLLAEGAQTAGDMSKLLDDLRVLLCLGNGAMNFGLCYAFGRSVHPVAAFCAAILVAWSDQIRIDHPDLLFSLLGMAGSFGGAWVGAMKKKKSDECVAAAAAQASVQHSTDQNSPP